MCFSALETSSYLAAPTLPPWGAHAMGLGCLWGSDTNQRLLKHNWVTNICHGQTFHPSGAATLVLMLAVLCLVGFLCSACMLPYKCYANPEIHFLSMPVWSVLLHDLLSLWLWNLPGIYTGHFHHLSPAWSFCRLLAFLKAIVGCLKVKSRHSPTHFNKA